ncbi:MAG: STAS-like domain-containing protein [Candidatus Binataceae bacterium]
MSRIEIRRELGSEIVTRRHGRRLREILEDALALTPSSIDALRASRRLRGIVEDALVRDPVVVDFDGLQVNSVSFFDEAFGQLALRLGEEELNRKVRFEGLDKFDTALLGDIISSRSREARKRRRVA